MKSLLVRASERSPWPWGLDDEATLQKILGQSSCNSRGRCRQNGGGRETLCGWRRVGPTGRVPRVATAGTMRRLRRPAGGGSTALLILFRTTCRLPARPRSRRLLAATPATRHLQETPIRFFPPVHLAVQGARIRARRRAKGAVLLRRSSRMAPLGKALELCQGAGARLKAAGR